MVNEKMSNVEQMTHLMSLQIKMAKMKKKNEEIKRMNEDGILTL